MTTHCTPQGRCGSDAGASGPSPMTHKRERHHGCPRYCVLVFGRMKVRIRMQVDLPSADRLSFLTDRLRLHGI